MNQITTTKNNALASFADKFNVDPVEMENTLKTTVFKQSGNNPITNEQMVMLMVVADQYNLNPFTKEIYAFPDKNGGVVPVVGVDGWSRLINSNKFFNGMEFNQSETMIKVDGDAKNCPEWMEVVFYRKDRDHPVVVREYLDEVYRPGFKGNGKSGPYTIKGPWQSHTKRMLRHKAMIQGARIAFGFAGIYDEDEADRIVDSNREAIVIDGQDFDEPKPASKVEQVSKKISTPNSDQKVKGVAPDVSAKAKSALKGKINKCRSLDALNDLLDECVAFSQTEFADELRESFRAKKKELGDG